MPVHVTTTTTQTLSNKSFSGPTRFNGDVTIFGDLSCNGTQTFNNTVFSTTSAVSVVHVGSGPALWVSNNGDGDIASFYDMDQNIEVLHVGGNNGTFPNVGVKTSSPNVDFTVNGAISAASIIYDAAGNSNNWNSTYSTVQTNSATTWNYQGTDIKALTAAWQSTYTTVNAQSANNSSVYSTVQTNSGAFSNASIGATIDGAGSAIVTGNKGSISVPYNATINSVTMVADVSGSVVADIKKSTFASYPTTASICAAAKPTITNNIKYSDNTLTGWTTTITSGDVLQFVIDSASTITKLTITLNVTKY